MQVSPRLVSGNSKVADRSIQGCRDLEAGPAELRIREAVVVVVVARARPVPAKQLQISVVTPSPAQSCLHAC